MRSAVLVLPCGDVLASLGRYTPDPLGAAVVKTAERLEAPADVVILAVPAGQGAGIAAKLEASARPVTRKPPARYIAERGATFDELGDVITAGPERTR